jgi:4-hydroxyphenylacetate 3-monooxygenase
MNNMDQIPAVQFTLGQLAAMQATLEGLIMGQIHCGEARYVYAALHWCTNHHADICEKVRELMGGGAPRAFSRFRRSA